MHHYNIHPLVIVSVVLFLIAYVTKFVALYSHNFAIQQAYIQQGEPFSCFELRPTHAINPSQSDNAIPSFGDASKAFWSLFVADRRSHECEEWHRKVTEWNVPDPSDVAWLVVTSMFTQPFSYLVNAFSLSIENFFSRQSMLVTVLIFALVAYILKLTYTKEVPVYKPIYYTDQFVMYK